MSYIDYKVGIVAKCDNFKVLKAVKEELVEAGIVEAAKWNKGWEEQGREPIAINRLAYLISKNPKGEEDYQGLQYHNHDCGIPHTYSGTKGIYKHFTLPQQWNEFVQAVKDSATAKATIVKAPISRNVVVSGYVAEIDMRGKCVKFGCQTISLHQLEVIRQMLSNGTLEAQFSVRGVNIPVEDVTILIDRISGKSVDTCGVTNYSVGKVYELRTEDNDYYYFKASDDGPGGGGMFKHRFIELKDDVLEATKVLCTDNFGYEKKLTVGKTYSAYPDIGGDKFWKITPTDNPDDSVAVAYKIRFTEVKESSMPFNIGDKFTVSFDIVYTINEHKRGDKSKVTITWVDKNSKEGSLTYDKEEVAVYITKGEWKLVPKKRVVYCVDNKMGYAAGELTIGKAYEVVQEDKKAGTITVVNDKGKMDYYRSTRFSDTYPNPMRGWKVGDTITSKFLNDRNIDKEFHGYDAGWNIYAERCFVNDRTVEVIEKREGKMAARISNTSDIWITLESLEKHP